MNTNNIKVNNNNNSYPADIHSLSLPYTNNTLIVNGIFILLLSFTGTIVATSLSSEKKEYILNNLLMKNLLVIALIFFAMSYPYDINTPKHPLTLFIDTIFVWLAYIMFFKLNSTLMVIGLILIIFYYVLTVTINYQEYYYNYLKNTNNFEIKYNYYFESTADNLVKSNKKLIWFQKNTIIILICVLIFGYLHHLINIYDLGYFEWKDIF